LSAMNVSTLPIAQDLVLLGGGHSHAIALQRWAMRPLPGVRVTLVSDQTHTPYSGMLPGHVAGVYEFDECHIDLRRLCQAAGAQFYLDEAVGLDLAQQKLVCREHPAIAFDLLSLDIGSTPAAVNVPGAEDYAIPAKPVPLFLQQWEALITSLQSDPRALSLGVVGGGAGGVELTISLLARLRQVTPNLTHQLHLFQRGPTLLPNHGPRTGRQFLQLLQGQGVQVHLNSEVQTIEPASIKDVLSVQSTLGQTRSAQPPVDIRHAQGVERCDAEGSLLCNRLFWVTNASAPAWLAASGLATDDRGFVLVGDTLQSISHPSIFAAGDIATMAHHPRPKAGVFAVRQGKPLFENLQRLLQGQDLQPFAPQKELLALIGTGQGKAVASRGRWSLGPSKLLWWWKDRIDRQFMERFSELEMMGEARKSPLAPLSNGGERSRQASVLLPESDSRDNIPTTPPPFTKGGRGGFLAASALPQSAESKTSRGGFPAMYCSGCGAKVGSTILSRTLNRLREAFPGLVLDNPDDAAVLALPTARSQANSDQPVLIQTVDYFTALVSDPFVFGQITTNHCLNDILAMGAQPHSVMALAQVPHGGDRPIEETLYQLLSGALTVLAQTNTQLIGGHTVEGNELAFGLSCNGLSYSSLGQPGQLWRKGGMEPGQALILTKALGTGTLFAAAGQGEAKGRWIDSAIASMLQSNAPAVEILRKHQTTACTDVTGFGLLGHLGEMVQAAGVDVELDVRTLPLLPGTAETLAQGLVSSMERQNTAAQRWVSNWADGVTSLESDGRRSRILFDPQTSGGLLATLPLAAAERCIAALQARGYDHCKIIGRSLSAQTSPSIRIR